MTLVEFFTFGLGRWSVWAGSSLIDDWLGRGGPGGAALGFLVGGILLLPIARTYGRWSPFSPTPGPRSLTRSVLPLAAAFRGRVDDALLRNRLSVGSGGRRQPLARIFPDLNTLPLYEVAGRTIFAPGWRSESDSPLSSRGSTTGGPASRRLPGRGDLRAPRLLRDLHRPRVRARHPANLPPLFARPARRARGSPSCSCSGRAVLLTGFFRVGRQGVEAARRAFPGAVRPRDHARRRVRFSVLYDYRSRRRWIFPWRELVAGRLRDGGGVRRDSGRPFSRDCRLRRVSLAAEDLQRQFRRGDSNALRHRATGARPSFARARPSEARHAAPRDPPHGGVLGTGSASRRRGARPDLGGRVARRRGRVAVELCRVPGARAEWFEVDGDGDGGSRGDRRARSCSLKIVSGSPRQ